MRSLAPLLWSAPYREPVLEGFIASIGGLDGRLRKSVSAAVAQQLSGELPCRAKYYMLLHGNAGACLSALLLR